MAFYRTLNKIIIMIMQTSSKTFIHRAKSEISSFIINKEMISERTVGQPTRAFTYGCTMFDDSFYSRGHESARVYRHFKV